MEDNKIRSLIISPPSFLKELCVKHEEICLICLKDDISKEEHLPTLYKCESAVEDSLDVTLEVTGSPLEVDLQGDISFALSEKIKMFDLWTEEETKYLPLTIREARRYMNEHIRKGNCELSGDDLPLFVICEDKNSNTVMLGVHKIVNSLVTCKIDILGYLLKDHELLSISYIENIHLLNMRTNDCKTTFLTTFKYYLYGTYIQDIRNIYDSEYFGSICIEVKSNNKCILKSPLNESKRKNLILQVIAGHPSSSVNFLWTDLCLLQSYIDILNNSEKCDNPETVISSTKRDDTDIYKSINNIVKSSLLKREVKIKFDLDNIRSENIIDKLWSILKDCNDLCTLRNCFHYFFEELAEPEVTIKIPDRNSSNIAGIISGILEGKLAVPTITYAQALTFLFELGAEKLKNDYQTIIKNFCPISEGLVEEQWSKLQSNLKLQGEGRKTRATVCLRSGQMDSTHNISKLTFLGKLHVVTELIYLVKGEAFLPDDTFDYFCEKVYENYFQRDYIEDFVDLKYSPRCEFAINIDLDDNPIKNDIPVMWSIQMTSTTSIFELTTIYHLSKFQIFPPTIYDRYDLNDVIASDPEAYYVCKLEMAKEVI